MLLLSLSNLKIPMFYRSQYNEVLASWPEGQGGIPEFDAIR
jgi:hypothetical protein